MTLDNSIATLEKIDRNLNKFQKILGKSIDKDNIRARRNISGPARQATIGQGKNTIEAKN